MMNETLQALLQQIRALAKEPDDPLEAAIRIDEIREALSETATIGECYLRNLLRVLPSLPDNPSPIWAEEAMASMPPQKPLTRSVDRLLRALPSDTPEATIETRPNVVEIYWAVSSCLTWVVRAPMYRWPGVNVRVYVRPIHDRPAMKARTVLLAHRLIGEALPYFRCEEG